MGKKVSLSLPPQGLTYTKGKKQASERGSLGTGGRAFQPLELDGDGVGRTRHLSIDLAFTHNNTIVKATLSVISVENLGNTFRIKKLPWKTEI